jgi:HD superfamily phosphodiesterase
MRHFPVLSSDELQRLLDGLSAGADKPLFSPDDWATRLGDGPAAGQFVKQMRAEWLPASIPDETCQHMMGLARSTLEGQRGWPHLWAHTLRVTGTALALAPEVDVEASQAFVLGIFHDIGKLDELWNGGIHEEVGAAVAREKLIGYYDPQIVTLITDAIAKTASPSNPYMRLITDADKLDKIGATGIARRLSTNSGTLYVGLALRRVEDELNSFPDMQFPTSQRLAALKKEFTESFLLSLNRPGSQDAF